MDIAYQALFAVDLLNGTKVGEMVRLNGRSEFTFKDSKIYEITDFSGAPRTHNRFDATGYAEG